MSSRSLALLGLVLAAAAPTGCRRQAVAPVAPTPPPAAAEAAAPATSPPAAAEAAGWSSVRVVRGPEDCPQGPVVGCEAGDLRLENDVAVFVVEGPGRGQDFALTGGNLVDAALRGRPDLLSQAYLYLDDTFPRQARYGSVTIADAGGPGRPAVVRAEGVDSQAPGVGLVTEYRLAPGAPYLCLETTATQNGEATLQDYELGDAIQWGATRHFAPGPGFALKGHVHQGAWIASVGPETSYAWVAPEGPMRTLSGSSWSDPIVASVELAPGQPARYRRCLVPGTGDVASLMGPIGELTGLPLTQHAGRVTEEGGGVLGSGEVEIRDAQGRPFALAEVDARGGFEILLPPGAFTAEGRYPGRRTVAPARFDAERRVADVVLSRQGVLQLAVDEERDGAQVPVPARITLVGLDGTPTPDLGAPWAAPAAGNRVLLAKGRGEARLPPGRYRVHASRGLEYDLATREVEIRADARATLQLTLRRSVDTTGWIAADLHQHASNSYDAFTGLEARVVSNAAEGVELLVGTDHDHVTDYAPVIERLGLGTALTSVAGVEVTTSDTGHFNCFPMPVRPGEPGDGAPPSFEVSPATIFAACRAASAEVVVQANHPRASGDGYFRLTGLDAATGEAREAPRSHPHVSFDPGFDALEVMNGKRPQDTPPVLADWFALLNRGLRYTGTANSDTHGIVDDAPGYPRSFIRLGDDPAKVTAAALVRAVKGRRAVVGTNGPFPELSSGDIGVGGTVRVRLGEPVPFRIRVQAADWVSVDHALLVRDGAEAARIPLDPKQRTALRYEGEQTLRFTRSGWVVLLVQGSEPLGPVLPSPEDRPLTAFAFTNPIYVEVDGG